MTRQRFTQEHIEHYQTHGYALIQNFLNPPELEAIYQAVEGLLPGWQCAVNPELSRPENWQAPPELVVDRRFPFPNDALNAVTFHPELRRFAAEICGHNRLFCEQSDLTYKCRGHRRDTDQLMHMDYGNHTLTYPASAPEFWQTTFLIYYTDVTPKHAPTAVVSWTHYHDETHWPIIHTREERPDLYAAETLAVVPAGSVLAYSTRTYHRGTAFTGPGGRLAQFISYAPQDCPWVGIVGWPAQGDRKAYRRWIEQSSVSEREMIGFPRVGHLYWTDEMIRGVQARFPKLDMTPYIEALDLRQKS